jgi:hypothetical protein
MLYIENKVALFFKKCILFLKTLLLGVYDVVVFSYGVYMMRLLHDVRNDVHVRHYEGGTTEVISKIICHVDTRRPHII